jgi:hypothetical protein
MDRNGHPDRWRELWPSLTAEGRVWLVLHALIIVLILTCLFIIVHRH